MTRRRPKLQQRRTSRRQDRLWKFDPRTRTKELIDHLINDVAKPALLANGRGLSNARLDAEAADVMNIWAGKEDVEGYATTLFNVLDTIPDDERRRKAYAALYHVLHGTFRVAKSGIYPLDEMRHSGRLQATGMRKGTSKDMLARDAIVLSVVAERKKLGEKSKKRWLGPVNAALAEAKRPPITMGVLYETIRQRRRQL